MKKFFWDPLSNSEFCMEVPTETKRAALVSSTLAKYDELMRIDADPNEGLAYKASNKIIPVQMHSLNTPEDSVSKNYVDNQNSLSWAFAFPVKSGSRESLVTRVEFEQLQTQLIEIQDKFDKMQKEFFAVVNNGETRNTVKVSLPQAVEFIDFQITIPESCEHDPNDTGFGFAYCKKCNTKMRFVGLEWKAQK